MVTIENENNKLWLDDGILFSVFKKPTDMTLGLAKSAIELRHNISNNQCQYWCMNLKNLKHISKEAKQYINENGQELLYACAIVVNSHLMKFMVTVFNRMRKPKIPVEIFTSEIEAISWLKGLEKMNKNDN